MSVGWAVHFTLPAFDNAKLRAFSPYTKENKNQSIAIQVDSSVFKQIQVEAFKLRSSKGKKKEPTCVDSYSNGVNFLIWSIQFDCVFP